MFPSGARYMSSGAATHPRRLAVEDRPRAVVRITWIRKYSAHEM